MDSGDTIAHGDHRAGFGDVDGPLVILDLLAQDAGYFVRSNLSHKSFRLTFRTQAAFESCQFAANRAVVDRGTNPGHHAANQRIVHGEAHADTLAGKLFQPAVERGALLAGEFARRRNFRAGEAQALIEHHLKSLNDAGERGERSEELTSELQ